MLLHSHLLSQKLGHSTRSAAPALTQFDRVQSRRRLDFSSGFPPIRRTLYSRAFRLRLRISSMSERAGTSWPKFAGACGCCFGSPSSMVAARKPSNFFDDCLGGEEPSPFDATLGDLDDRVGRRRSRGKGPWLGSWTYDGWLPC